MIFHHSRGFQLTGSDYFLSLTGEFQLTQSVDFSSITGGSQWLEVLIFRHIRGRNWPFRCLDWAVSYFSWLCVCRIQFEMKGLYRDYKAQLHASYFQNKMKPKMSNRNWRKKVWEQIKDEWKTRAGLVLLYRPILSFLVDKSTSDWRWSNNG